MRATLSSPPLLLLLLLILFAVGPTVCGTSEKGAVERDKRMSALLRWLEGGGVQLGGVEAVWREGMGWALRASKRISPGETFLKVPRHLLLGPHQLRASSLDRLLEGWQLPDCMLLLLMCESVNSSSFFRPYLDLLPDTVDTPITWSKEEAKELVGSPVLHRAVKLRHELARSFQEMKDKVFDKYPDRFPPLLFSYERYQWAYSILRSRAFGNYTLMPLIDLMNHHPDSRLAPTLLSDGSDALIARREYNVGDEVWGFYGRKSDADLLLNYGFTSSPYHHNKFNQVELVLDLDLSRPSISESADLKHMLVQACGFSITQQKFALYKGLISSSLITFLSIDAADDVDGEETLIALAHGDVRTMRVQMLSNILDKVFRKISHLARALLTSYPSGDLVADLKRWRGGGRATRRRQALTIRMVEKDVLTTLDQHARMAAKMARRCREGCELLYHNLGNLTWLMENEEGACERGEGGA